MLLFRNCSLGERKSWSEQVLRSESPAKYCHWSNRPGMCLSSLERDLDKGHSHFFDRLQYGEHSGLSLGCLYCHHIVPMLKGGSASLFTPIAHIIEEMAFPERNCAGLTLSARPMMPSVICS